MAENWQEAGFGIYVHWPFCQSKCPYCDFNSHVRAEIDQTRWRAGLLRELDWVAARLPDRTVSSIFFGGGTPSLMDPETVAAVIEAVGRHWVLADDLEVSLEANPGSVEAGRFRAYGTAGVGRVSMGIQSLRDADLKRLGRLHTAAEARAAFDIARAAFDRVSFDLIYARQDQTVADWQAELAEATAMAVDHLSLYQLTIEPETRFGELFARGRLRGLPDAELGAGFYEATQMAMEAIGMPAYEVSNHARSGAACRHNLIYWRGGDWAGIGPGAHGRFSAGRARSATETLRGPEQWLVEVERKGHGMTETRLGPRDHAEDYLMMGLRLSEGIGLDRYRHLGGVDLETGFLVAEGFLKEEDGRLIATPRGRLVLNAVISELLPSPVDV